MGLALRPFHGFVREKILFLTLKVPKPTKMTLSFFNDLVLPIHSTPENVARLLIWRDLGDLRPLYGNSCHQALLVEYISVNTLLQRCR